MSARDRVPGGRSIRELATTAPPFARFGTADRGVIDDDQVRAYMIGIARSEPDTLRDASGGQNITKDVVRASMTVADITPSEESDPETDDAPLTEKGFERILAKFLTPLKKKISAQSLVGAGDETPHVRTIHYVFDSRYCRELSGGTMKFLLTPAGPTEGAYSLRDAENVFEISVGELSLPTDIPWGSEAEQTNRSEITLLFNEASAWAYHDAENAHHFRGYADSIEIASYLYYFGSTASVISDAITSNQSALVRWYDRKFVFDEPFSFRGEASLTWRRSGVEIPFYACVYDVTVATGGVTVTFADSVSIATADALLLADTVFFESSAGDGTGTTVITKGVAYTVTVVAGGTRTFTISASAGAVSNASLRMVVPKWRLRADVAMRCLTSAQTNYTQP